MTRSGPGTTERVPNWEFVERDVVMTHLCWKVGKSEQRVDLEWRSTGRCELQRRLIQLLEPLGREKTK